MASLADIRSGIAANLAALDGVQVSAYLLANPTPPTCTVYPDEVVYDRAGARGLDVWSMKVQAFVGVQSDLGAQQLLDEMLASSGTQSVKALVETDKTLGGVAHDTRVTGCSGYRIYPQDGRAAVLGAEWSVDVYATGA